MVVSDPMNTINIMSGIHVSEIDSSLLKGAGRSLLFDRQVKTMEGEAFYISD